MDARCECPSRSSDTPFCQHCNDSGVCARDAVRMVTVHTYGGRLTPPPHASVEKIEHVPMCEPCARWHEAKAGAR
jgi:hypothetical protein